MKFALIVLGSKSGYVWGLGHGEVANILTQCNYIELITTKKRLDQLQNQVEYLVGWTNSTIRGARLVIGRTN